MKNLEVLLRDNVKTLGKCGDVVRVAPGYARNFLFPRRIAVEANDDNKRMMTRRRAKLDVEEATKNAEIDARVASLAGVVVKTTARADETGSLYGSVNSAMIVELLGRAGHTFQERDVRMEAPLKTVGTHTVRVHVHSDKFAEIQVVVDAEAVAS